MAHDPEKILAILDDCCDRFTFPMLDNGYVYLAATRLTAHYSETNWALVIEIFGYSPRGGYPDIHVHTFASDLRDRDSRDQYVTDEAYERYLANNPNNESRFFYPVDGDYQDFEIDERVANNATHILLRGEEITLPTRSDYASHEIDLEDEDFVHVYELCRYVAATRRESILATVEERTVNVLNGMNQILQLEEWHHPDLINNERPNNSEAFQQLARVLSNGDPSEYQPTRQPNTHWSNWPEGGSL
jgi:hypothetical protein